MCYCNESPWFEQLRAVPLRRRVWSCLLVTFIHDFFCGCGNCKVKFINSWLFPREEMWKGRAVLKRLLMLHQPWAGESCCTCQRPFVQLSLHSAADAPHTLAGVKCCQAHLWPSVKGHDMRICIVGRIHEFELCVFVLLAIEVADTHCGCTGHSFPATCLIQSSSSTVTSGLQMWFSRHVFPANSLPVKAPTEVLDLNESLSPTCFVFFRVQV